jgi:hypothetical protein
MVKSMSESQLEELASAKRKKLPTRARGGKSAGKKSAAKKSSSKKSGSKSGGGRKKSR